MPYLIAYFGGRHRFLSNFYPSPIKLGELEYPTVEHAYQAAKANNEGDHTWVADSKTPGEAKRRGRRCNIRSDWEQVKLDVMYDCVKAKFAQNPELLKLLLATGDDLLEEGNNWGDTFWGVCNGRGKNHLGKILMRVREELRNVDGEGKEADPNRALALLDHRKGKRPAKKGKRKPKAMD